MADANLKINVTTDAKQAEKGLKSLDDQVGKTGDGIGKLGKAAIAGGAALVAVGVKSVLAFEDLGLTVGKFADATGLTTEQASRLIEVGDDIGISAETMSAAIGKMSKQLGANEAAFKAYGIEVAKTADGTTDVNETFLRTVDAINRIPDPLKRAEASAKVFGKGYQQMSELLGKSSAEIRANLAAVADQKIFDDKKVQEAREMRAAFDTIKDAGEDLLLTIGHALAPTITKLAPTLEKVIKAAGPLADAIGKVLVSALEAVGPILEGLLPLINAVAKALSLLADVIGKFKPTGFTKEIAKIGDSFDAVKQKAVDAGISTEEFDRQLEAAKNEVKPTGDVVADLATIMATLDAKIGNLTGSTETAQNSMKGYSYAVDDVKQSTEDATAAVDAHKLHTEIMANNAKRKLDELAGRWDALYGVIDNEQVWLDIQTGFDNVAAKMAEAGETGDKSAQEIEQGWRDARQAVLDQEKEVANYAEKVLGLPPERVTKMIAAIDAGNLADVEAQLANLTRNRDVNLQIVARGGAGYGSGGPRAAGGPTSPGFIYPVAERRRPELYSEGGQQYLIPGGSGQVTPMNEATSVAPAGGDTIVHVHGSVIAERELVSIIKRYTRGGGQL